MSSEIIERLLACRKKLAAELQPFCPDRKIEEEGGCGVVGFCCTEPVAARHIYEPSRQMHNRGNGKGGGIAALGFVPEQMGVSREVLEESYMLHVAFLDNTVRQVLESKYITPCFDVLASGKLDTVEDWTTVEGLEARPPDVYRYFVRCRAGVTQAFIEKNGLTGLDAAAAEAEFISQNSIRLNQEYYASLGEQKAFVMSEGKNIMILKVVGYAEAIVKYYRIEELRAHVWIAHQRFPTKGRVWHPGGAHPFGGINAALVHNGDFANYHSVCEYLAERHIHPQFLTDTEVSILMFDLLQRTYGYPLEYIIEALAPTSELDFDRLPADKQAIYRAIQATHIHGSPDGPWFFIIARSLPENRAFQLMGITDTAMLRPQVFAFCDGDVQVGLIASEKQAIDATLLSLHAHDARFCPVADRYWNARGGSHTDGGAFIFDLQPGVDGRLHLSCSDKFGKAVPMPPGITGCNYSLPVMEAFGRMKEEVRLCFDGGDTGKVYTYLSGAIRDWNFEELRAALDEVVQAASDPDQTAVAIEALTLLNDQRYPMGDKKRNHVVHLVMEALNRVFRGVPQIGCEGAKGKYRLIDKETRRLLVAPINGASTLVIDASGFDPEGEGCDATLLMDAYIKGWRNFINFNCVGQRFTGCGLGPGSEGVTIDVYGSSGDYLASGMDGLAISVHGNAQDQVGQIIKSGKLVIHGDVGQTFMYGAKGGSIYVMGNAAGRPLINSVGRPRVVINGTCLDFLGESFMAGDVLNGGGFVILNGVGFDEQGNLAPLREPYPGSNLFSLASGGAIYIRDPRQQVVWQQLNGCGFYRMADEDWELILPYLEENERLFGIRVEDLLTVDGRRMKPWEVYRKVAPVKIAALGKKTEEKPATETELLTLSTGE
jgi:glutamate synthase domain-containing protein 1/glutamate synthase domain-containing protein 3